MVEVVYQFQDYSFVLSQKTDLYQLVFYKFAGQFSKDEHAQFITPLPLIDFLVNIVNPRNGETVIDPKIESGLVVSVKYPDDPNWSFEKVHDYCYARGFTIYPGKISTSDTFRLCALGAIDEPDIVAFFKVFEQALDQFNIHHG